METQRHLKGHAGPPKGNPRPAAHQHDMQRRPSPNPETGARSGGSVRSDRSNKFWSPGTNAPRASRASRHSRDTTAPTAGAKSIRTSTSPSAKGRGAARAQETPAKGQINGRGFGRRRAPFAAGPRLRHQDVQNYPMGSDRAQTQSRNPGPRSGNVGSDRKREASSPKTRTTWQRLMDWHPTRRVPIPFKGENKTPVSSR